MLKMCSGSAIQLFHLQTNVTLQKQSKERIHNRSTNAFEKYLFCYIELSGTLAIISVELNMYSLYEIT